jgi:hypothetical protein
MHTKQGRDWLCREKRHNARCSSSHFANKRVEWQSDETVIIECEPMLTAENVPVVRTITSDLRCLRVASSSWSSEVNVPTSPQRKTASNVVCNSSSQLSAMQMASYKCPCVSSMAQMADVIEVSLISKTKRSKLGKDWFYLWTNSRYPSFHEYSSDINFRFQCL